MGACGRGLYRLPIGFRAGPLPGYGPPCETNMHREGAPPYCPLRHRHGARHAGREQQRKSMEDKQLKDESRKGEGEEEEEKRGCKEDEREGEYRRGRWKTGLPLAEKFLLNRLASQLLSLNLVCECVCVCVL